ncbi:hypothetical protein FN846DRAFT_887146 [Sphaerosporella brunnea]|uniref:Protein kinase domain-containing protein n=1 Tax=Sphaerosporella brunnea TaxID=1250544 RepID=A0A5J5F7I9_9PEZI|nr:hypothetical protein FN846DRAFT_887146 [Sphaerosporella brunnea]
MRTRFASRPRAPIKRHSKQAQATLQSSLHEWPIKRNATGELPQGLRCNVQQQRFVVYPVLCTFAPLGISAMKGHRASFNLVGGDKLRDGAVADSIRVSSDGSPPAIDRRWQWPLHRLHSMVAIAFTLLSPGGGIHTIAVVFLVIVMAPTTRWHPTSPAAATHATCSPSNHSRPCAHIVTTASASEASAHDTAFSPISYSSLKPIDPDLIDRFRRYIRSLDDRVDFSLVPTAGSPVPDLGLSTATDGRCFVHSELLLPTWPVIVSMLPTDRNYAWKLKHEHHHSQPSDTGPLLQQAHCGDNQPSECSVCDVVIIQYDQIGLACDAWNSKVALAMQLKRRSGVYDVRRFLESGIHMAEEWDALTRQVQKQICFHASEPANIWQVRKYAVDRRCHYHVAMDERFAIYFHFTSLSEYDDESCVYYLTASTELQSSPDAADNGVIDRAPVHDLSNQSPVLNVRQLIAFAAWTAVPPCTVADNAESPHRVYPASAEPPLTFPADYISLKPSPPPPRPPVGRRNWPQSLPCSCNATVEAAVEDSIVPLRCDFAERSNTSPDPHVKQSTQLECHESKDCMCDHLRQPKNAYYFEIDNPHDIVGPLRITNSDRPGPLELGICACGSAGQTRSGDAFYIKSYLPSQQRNLEGELPAYAALRHLQGRGIPEVMGFYERDDSGFLLLQKPVSAALQSLATVVPCFPPTEWAALDALEKLLASIHAGGVVHGGLHNPENVLISPSGREVAIVGFEASKTRWRVPLAPHLRFDDERALAEVWVRCVARWSAALRDHVEAP